MVIVIVIVLAGQRCISLRKSQVASRKSQLASEHWQLASIHQNVCLGRIELSDIWVIGKFSFRDTACDKQFTFELTSI
jgi:hypothetical protein